MVVSHLPAGCRVDSSASCPLDSASTTTSAYQRPAASCPLAHIFPFASFCWLVIASPLVVPPLPCIAFRRTAASHVHPQPPLFVRAGWLLCPILSHCLHLSTRRWLTCCLLRHLCLKSASSPSLAPPFSLPPLSVPRPSPASSNARHTLPATSLPTASVPSRMVLVLQHVRLCAGSRVASCGTFALNPPARPLSHRHFRRTLSRRRGHRRCPQMHGALSRRRHRQRPLFPLVRLSSSNTSACVAASSSLQLNHPPSLLNSRHILEEGDDVEAFYVCVKFTLCKSRSTMPRGPPRLTNKRKFYTYLFTVIVFSPAGKFSRNR